MSDARRPGAVLAKPKREDFRTDDDFGEAYAFWRIQQVSVAATSPVSAPVRPVVKAPPAKPVVNLASPAGTVLPRQSEAEREAWNLSTKARFWRAKNSASGIKGK